MGTKSCLYPLRTRQGLLTVAMALVWPLAAASVPAQNVPAISQPLLLPGGLAYDASGNLYVAETGNHAIRRIDATGILTTVAGTGVQGFAGDGGPATAAPLDSPLGVAIDSKGDIYVADTHNQRIRRIDAVSGTIATVAGTGVAGFGGDGGPATQAQLNLPTALALDASGNLYIADSRNHRIRRVDALTGTIATVVGDGRQGWGGDGGPAAAASLDSPYGLAFDGAGNLYVADSHNQRVRRVDRLSQIISTVSGNGVAGFTGDGGLAAASGLNLPRGIALDAGGNLYVADLKNERIRRVDAVSGAIATTAGQGTQGFAGDGQAAVAALLDSPRAVTLSPGGLATLSDTANERVRQVDGASIIHTIGGVAPLATGTLALTGISPGVYGTGSVTATLVSSAASGTVAFYETLGGSASVLGTVALANNAAVFDTSGLGVGSHELSATYAGDATHAPAQSGMLQLAVTQAPSVSSLTVTPLSAWLGSTVSLNVQVTSATRGTPTGSVLLLDSGAPPVTSSSTATPLATVALNASGSAAFSLSTLSLGGHTLTAVYSGDGNFLAGTSVPVVATINAAPAPDFSLAATGQTSLTVTPGSTATFNFSVQQLASEGVVLSSPVSLGVTGLPLGATASFSPAYVPPGSAATAVVLTIQTPLAVALPVDRKGIYWVVVLPLLVCVRKRRRQLFACLFVSALGFATGCGTREYKGPVAASSTTYVLDVTGTATGLSGGAVEHSASVTLILKQ